MKKIWKSQTGAAMVVEAVIIYPIVLMCLFFLIYVGLIVIQSSVLNSTAQKMAMLAAREVAYPGYLSLSAKDNYGSSAVEMTKGSTVKLTFNTQETKIDAYRYWGKDPLSSGAKDIIRQVITDPKKGIIKTQSLLDLGKIEVNVSCANYVVTQYVTVTIEQELKDIAVLKYFGIETPKMTVRAVAAVNDADEFARNVELAEDAVQWLAKKLGIDLSKLREKVDSALDRIGLNK